MRTIGVFTGTRAEYGTLRPLMRGIQEAPDLSLRTYVSGAHLEAMYGLTVREIEEDGFPIDARVKMSLRGDSARQVSQALGVEIAGFGQVFGEERPDILVVLGDRWEMMGAALSALVANVPIAHIHGGEATEGLIDEAIRHAVTKMSHIHFVAAPEFRDRVLQMGENPERVFVTGSPGLDELMGTPRLPSAEIFRALDIPATRPILVLTYHPVTLPGEDPSVAIREITAGIDVFGSGTVVVTHPNAEVGRQEILRNLEAWSRARPGTKIIESLGRARHVAVVSAADVVIGNSSSGLVDAPALGTPTVNIGMRQDGRLKADSVIDCAPERSAIAEALRLAVSDEFKKVASETLSPYGDGAAVPRIVDVLAGIDLDGLLVKRFHSIVQTTARRENQPRSVPTPLGSKTSDTP